jgi:hypothetical protein
MTRDVTPLEWKMVADLIHRELAEMPTEIRRTETSTYRDELKVREQKLRELLKKVEAAE